MLFQGPAFDANLDPKWNGPSGAPRKDDEFSTTS
jgi:hypothetical protein